MAKQIQGKVRTKNILGGKGAKAELPINTADSNATGDQQANLIHVAVMGVAVVLTLLLLAWATGTAMSAVQVQPPNWFGVFTAMLMVAMSIFIGRGILWLSFIGPAMLGARNGAWKSQEEICRRALKFGRLFPNGGSMAAYVLVQNLIGRGQFESAIEVGEEQWKQNSDKKNVDDNLGPICYALGIAHGQQGDTKQSLLWNERAIELFSKALDSFVNKKTLFAKIAGKRGEAVTSNLNTQLFGAYFNNAMVYFNQRNYRQAKHNFQKALEHGSQSAEFPEKAMMLKACKDQIARLKHS